MLAGMDLRDAKKRPTSGWDGSTEARCLFPNGFGSLGCHLPERWDRELLEKKGERLYFLQRWAPPRSLRRARQRVQELTPGARHPADIREVVFALKPLLPGGPTSARVLCGGREPDRWPRDFQSVLIHGLRGTVRCPRTSI